MAWAVQYLPELLFLIVLGVLFTTKAGRRTVRALAVWWVDSIPGRVSLGVSLLAAMAVVCLPVLLDGLEMPGRAHVVLAVFSAQLLATGLPLLHEEAAVRSVKQFVGSNDDFKRTLLPLTAALKRLDELPTGSKKTEARGNAKTVALTAASILCGGQDNIRASYFEVQGLEPSRELVPGPTHSVGRADSAQTKFEESTPLGAGMFAALDGGNVLHCPSIDLEPPHGWDQALSPVWKSFVSAPVVFEGCLLGMLTVDSPSEGAFDEDRDAALLATVANLYALAVKT